MDDGRRIGIVKLSEINEAILTYNVKAIIQDYKLIEFYQTDIKIPIFYV